MFFSSVLVTGDLNESSKYSIEAGNLFTSFPYLFGSSSKLFLQNESSFVDVCSILYPVRIES